MAVFGLAPTAVRLSSAISSNKRCVAASLLNPSLSRSGGVLSGLRMTADAIIARVMMTARGTWRYCEDRNAHGLENDR